VFKFSRKGQSSVETTSQLASFLHVIRNHSIKTENFLDSLSYFTKVFSASAASIYLYEKKTNMFILKKWHGKEPTRYSISGSYEFITYLKTNEVPTHRKEFTSSDVNEYRESALFYFQHTLSSVVCPLLENNTWLGLVNINLSDESYKAVNVFDTLMEIYADSLKKWLLYQEISQENKKLSEISHVKNELLANVTHELQTPLNGILGLTDIILDGGDGKISTELRGHVQRIKKSGDELHKTVSNLLKLVQIEAKKEDKNYEKINLLDLIEEVALLYSEACREKSIGLIVPRSESKIWVYVNPDQIRTVLMNLIGNAVKFTEKGEVRVEMRRSGEMLHVGIVDTGIGIDEEKLSLIFEDFYQGDGTQTRVYGGTGLGLAIVKKIVTLYGGRIWVSSEKGQGSRFTFSLPTYPV